MPKQDTTKTIKVSALDRRTVLHSGTLAPERGGFTTHLRVCATCCAPFAAMAYPLRVFRCALGVLVNMDGRKGVKHKKEETKRRIDKMCMKALLTHARKVFVVIEKARRFPGILFISFFFLLFFA